MDSDGDGNVDIFEFLLAYHKLLTPSKVENNGVEFTGGQILGLGELAETFLTLDGDGDGMVSAQDLSGMLISTGGVLSLAEACAIVERADTNHDGLIDFQEFISMLSNPMTEGASWRLRTALRVVLVIGGPGSGKGVLCSRLTAQRYPRMKHVSSGEMLRTEVESGSLLGQQCEAVMQAGELLPSSVVTALVKRRMADFPGAYVLLDGFPRSRDNCAEFLEVFGPPAFAISIEVPDEVMMSRMLKRSGGRSDDNPETARRRLQTFHECGGPTMQYLHEHSVPVVSLDGTQTPEGVWKQLLHHNTPLTRIHGGGRECILDGSLNKISEAGMIRNSNCDQLHIRR